MALQYYTIVYHKLERPHHGNRMAEGVKPDLGKPKKTFGVRYDRHFKEKY